MRRGEIWWVDFGPAVSGEIRKCRPAVIVGNDSANQFLSLRSLCPLWFEMAFVIPSLRDNAIKLAVGHLEKTTNHANFRESIREDSRDS